MQSPFHPAWFSLVLWALAGCGNHGITHDSLPMIQGRLSEQGSGHSLPSVVVSLRSSGVYTTTDPDGFYAFHSLPGGPDTLVVDQSPWDRLEFPVRLTEGQTVVQDLVLVRDLVLPWLDLDPDSVDFGWDGDQHTVQLLNLGGGQLEWSLSGVPGWLEVSPMSGSGPASLTLTLDRESLEGPLDLSENLRVISNGGNLDLAVEGQVLDFPDVVVTNLLVDPVRFTVNGQPRVTLALGSSQRLRVNHNPVTVDWVIQPRPWEGQALGLAFAFQGSPVLLEQDLEVFSVNQISTSNGTGFQIFSPRIDNESPDDLYLVVNYNTPREWLGYARIPAGDVFPAGYYDAGSSTDPVNVMLFPDTTDLDHFYFLGRIPAGRQIAQPRESVANLRAAFQVNSGLVVIGCCSGGQAARAGALVLEASDE